MYMYERSQNTFAKGCTGTLTVMYMYMCILLLQTAFPNIDAAYLPAVFLHQTVPSLANSVMSHSLIVFCSIIVPCRNKTLLMEVTKESETHNAKWCSIS